MRWILLALLLLPAGLAAQGEVHATLRVRVTHEAAPVASAVVRAGPVAAQTSEAGVAVLLVPPGDVGVRVTRIGFRPESLLVTLRAAQDTTVDVGLQAQPAEVERVVVSATRSDRRIEDVPLRVEVLSRDEVEEKMLMTPGDISMMLNETGGLRVQATSPSLGGAGIRVQGLQGRYTLLLSDGLPLYGAQAGAFGLMQVPPMDLAQVEVIKGVASALYGSSALGGVINLVSRRPGDVADRELLVNQTSRDGTDLVGWSSERLGEHWGYTLLASAHRQARADIDGDGWTDVPGYRRAVVRPRLAWSGKDGRNALVTLGSTVEARRGGTLDGRTAPDGAAYAEALGTRRFDVGAIANLPLGMGVLSVRGSATAQLHDHQYGTVRERDRHETWFAEAALRAARGPHAGVVGVALEQERYAGREVRRFDYHVSTPALFAQYDLAPGERVALSASGRVDAHSAYGTVFNPRLSVLVRGPAEWTARASAGTGAFAPTPFTDETDVTGLSPLRPLAGVGVERARSASLDVGGLVGPFEVNATVFTSRIASALRSRAVPGAPLELELYSAHEPTRTSGADALLRLRTGAITATASYAWIRSTEEAADGDGRQVVPLTPSRSAGLVAMWEEEGRGRAGVELYYTGTQRLEENPWRTTSPAYVLVGAMAERPLGPARVFVNAENLGGIRLTRYHPLVLPARGAGGRWTADAWGPLDGRTINAGVRWTVGAGQ